MNEEYKVSVILPSYNEKDYIEQCMESVLNQTLKELEIICVDAGSTDGTLDILKQYAEKYPNVNVFLSDKKSYGAQVNQGITNAKGDYISIVETDDYIDSNMLESLYELARFGYVDISKSTFFHLKDDENDLRMDNVKRNLPQQKIFNLDDEPLFLEGHPSIWSAIYKRTFLINNDITFIEEEGGGWVDNPFFYETAIKADTIIYINEPYYYYRENNQNSSTNNLKDLSIPSRRIIDMFKVLDESDRADKRIKEMLYARLFRYVEITLKNNGYDVESLDYKTCKSLNQAFNLIDENYVHEKLSNKEKQYYYKFVSPLFLSKFSK